MRLVGRITEWNDARGFGFVVPNGGGERAFLHIKAFDGRGARPFEGALVSYALRFDERRRLQAAAVRFVRASRPSSRPSYLPWRSLVGLVALAVVAGGAWTGRLPAVLAVAYGAASALAFVMYGIDKWAARTDRWRTAEQTLHLVGLLGGWPGALLAQDVFRHKSRKAEFQVVFWILVVVNLVLAAWAVATGHLSAIGRLRR